MHLSYGACVYRFRFRFLTAEFFAGSGSSSTSSNERVIITRLATQRWLDVGTEWVEDVHKSHHSSMIYEYRVACTAHYYGKGCENLCRPRDDNFGHYRCSPTGQRVCLAGWKGDYCAIREYFVTFNCCYYVNNFLLMYKRILQLLELE